MMRRFLLIILTFIFAVSSSPAGAELIAPDSVQTGKAMYVDLGEASDGAVELAWLGKSLRLPAGETGAFLSTALGAQPGEHLLTAVFDGPDGARTVSKLVKVEQGVYPEQRLKVARKYTELNQAQLDRHYAEKKQVRTALDKATPRRIWNCPFVRPVEGVISSAFGLRRFFNDQPRKPHTGIDIAAAAGTPIKAFADGVVSLSGDHYFAGNSIYIDHGMGMTSMYFHLSEIGVNDGQTVKAGEVIGKVGKTGRVTGAHLHFGVSVLGAPVDPLPIIEESCP